MKRLILALLGAAVLSVSAARADHSRSSISISIGSPSYVSHGYYGGGGSGYWRDVTVNVWVPPHWAVRHNSWGEQVSVWLPGHYELRTRRAWVSGHGRHYDRWDHRDRGHWDRRDHGRWEHSRREHHGREHGRWDNDHRDHGRGRDWDRGRDRGWDRHR